MPLSEVAPGRVVLLFRWSKPGYARSAIFFATGVDRFGVENSKSGDCIDTIHHKYIGNISNC